MEITGKEQYGETIKDLKEDGLSWQEIAETLNLGYDQVRMIARNSDYYDGIKQQNANGSSEIDKKTKKADGTISSFIRKRLDEKRTFTQDELLELHGINADEFEIGTITSNEWSMTNGSGDKHWNYQSKLTAKPKSKDISFEQIREILSNDIKPLTVELLGAGDTNLVIQLADLHFGVTKIDMTKEKLAKLIYRIDYGYQTIVIEQLGDLFHSSQMKSSQTLKGTLLDDVDMAQAIEDAKTFFHAIITICLEKAEKVVIEHAGGNHSDNLEYMFLNYLEAKYPQVEVNYHNDTRRAYKLGNVGIMISHGDTVGLNKLPMLFANEYKLLWADSTVCEVHTAHKHNKYVEQEVDGVVLRQAPTIKPNDLYEIRNGWTTNRKIIQVIEYDEDGEVGSYVI